LKQDVTRAARHGSDCVGQAILPADALSRASSRLKSRLAAKMAAPQEPTQNTTLGRRPGDFG
jgi:hypothetical protein